MKHMVLSKSQIKRNPVINKKNQKSKSRVLKKMNQEITTSQKTQKVIEKRIITRAAAAEDAVVAGVSPKITTRS